MNEQVDFHERRQNRIRRQRRRSAKWVLAFVAVAVLFFYAILSSLSGRGDTPVTTPQHSASAVYQPAERSPADLPTDRVKESRWNTLTPAEQTINKIDKISPDMHMFSLPTSRPVTMAYFDNAIFIGDSITQGLQIYGDYGIPNASYCAYKSISPKQVFDGSVQTNAAGHQEVPMEVIMASEPKKVYVLLGTNSIVAMDDESLLAYYDAMLNALQEQLPADVIFYVQSITPVRPGIARLPQDRITNFNHTLARLAQQHSMHFINLNEVLAGDDGHLRAEFAGSDGYHLSPDGYKAWVGYLTRHTVHRNDNPYA